jgi:hypothetical protein
LTYRGQKIAEVWFKPEGEPFGLTFRVPKESFQIPGMGQRLTTENLLKAVAIATDDVASWGLEGVSVSGMNPSNPDFRDPLPPPPPDLPHVRIDVRLKPPPAVAHQESGDREVPEETWQVLEARWKALLGAEAAMDTLRISMEGLRAELEGSWKRTLTVDEKVHALTSDVVHWNKAKGRVHHALPKAKEFIHRATWAMGTPERKRLEELFKNHIGPRVPFPELEQLFEQLESVRKDRQVLSAQGTTVYQECKSILAEVQAALRTLQSTAAANAAKKKSAARKKGKYS